MALCLNTLIVGSSVFFIAGTVVGDAVNTPASKPQEE
jgi:hypothetical protein